MTAKIFIDGEHGTTGLQIRTRMADRRDVELLSIPEAERRNAAMREDLLNSADIAILCLPDEASKEAVTMLAGNNNVRVIDTSTAYRVDPNWAYGFAELDKAQADKTELEASELQGQMVRAEWVIEEWSRMLGALRSRMLSIPTKTAPRARGAMTDEEAATMIEIEVVEALQELSDDGLDPTTRARQQRRAASNAPAAAADGERVGRRVQAAVPGKRRRAGPVED